MDTIEQVLSLPSHSEVLPSLPCVSALLVCPYMYVHGSYMYVRALSHHIHISLSSFWTPFQEGGGKNKSSLLICHPFLQLLIMTPTFLTLSLFFLIWFFGFFFCIFPTLHLSLS